jgi:hypothetical protein
VKILTAAFDALRRASIPKIESMSCDRVGARTRKGEEHHESAAAGFDFIGDIGGSDCDARLGARRGARSWAS